MENNISNTPEGVLVRLQNKICKILGIDLFHKKLLIDKFVNSCFAATPNSKTHFAKVNIYNELTKNKMTIKVFFKFLKILNIKKVNISVTITTARDKEITVEEEVNLFNTEVDPDGF